MTDTKKRLIMYAVVLVLVGGLVWAGFLYRPDADVATLVNSAEVLAQVGGFEDAIDYSERALLQEPDNRYAHIILAYCAGQTGDLERGLRHYQRAIDLTADTTEGNLPLLRLYHADLLCRAGRPAEAEREAKAVLESDPTRHQARYLIARSLREQGQTGAAVEQYRAVMENLPEDPTPLALWAETERERENDQGAAELLDKLVVMAPENADFRMRKACVHEALGDRDSAVAETLVAADLKKAVAQRWLTEVPELDELRADPLLAGVFASTSEGEEKK